jgi:FtsP/CotA-like multicopper oxidase with cupredoxin domain
MLLNGWGHFNCSMALPARPLQCTDVTVRGIWPVLGPDYSPARVTRLRIVNVGTIAGVSLAIRGMKMTPIEVDGGTRVDNHGPAADAIGILYPGERIDVILEVDSNNVRHQGSLLVSLDTE